MAHQIQKLLRTTPNVIGLRALSSKYHNVSDMQKNNLHLAAQKEYPQAEQLPLPPNIDANEATRFSPFRSRDITSSAITVHEKINEAIDVTSEQIREVACDEQKIEDAHLRSYDKHSPINLSSTMQTQVPEPFVPPPNDLLYSSYLSFPGGSWGQQTKYLSHELNAAHYTELRQELRSGWSSYKGCINSTLLYSNNNRMFGSSLQLLSLYQNSTNMTKRYIMIGNVQNNNSSNETKELKPEKETGRAKLKKAVKEYGATVVVFHVGISLVSLGICYTLVSSGLDVCLLLEKMNLADKLPKMAENASTFIIAYAVHKVFAPVRISITLFSAPFIVKYLRRKNILK